MLSFEFEGLLTLKLLGSLPLELESFLSLDFLSLLAFELLELQLLRLEGFLSLKLQSLALSLERLLLDSFLALRVGLPLLIPTTSTIVVALIFAILSSFLALLA